MKFCGFGYLVILLWASLNVYAVDAHGVQPLSRIAIHKATFDLHVDAYVKASPRILGLQVRTWAISLIKYASVAKHNAVWMLMVAWLLPPYLLFGISEFIDYHCVTFFRKYRSVTFNLTNVKCRLSTLVFTGSKY